MKLKDVAAMATLLLGTACGGGPFLIFPGGALSGAVVNEPI